jgi:hypothetical protein
MSGEHVSALWFGMLYIIYFVKKKLIEAVRCAFSELILNGINLDGM